MTTPSETEIKNVWFQTSTLPYVFVERRHTKHRVNFTFTFTSDFVCWKLVEHCRISNLWFFGLGPSFETGSVSVLRSWGRHLFWWVVTGPNWVGDFPPSEDGRRSIFRNIVYYFAFFLNTDDGQSPITQKFQILCTIVRTLWNLRYGTSVKLYFAECKIRIWVHYI
jgi:hypothetical protein